jgi:hypothetical protein
MDIHAPEKPIHSLKDFGIHIAVVTVGIVIALGLEGVRETIHDHRLVRETRENERHELESDLDHAQREAARVMRYNDELKAMVIAMPAAAQQHPAEFAAELQGVRNPGYFFSGNAWSAALSTGALAHMSTEEVSAYAYAAEGMKNYSTLQAETRMQEARVKAYVAAHPTMTPDQLAEVTERLILFAKAEESLAYYVPQMQGDIERALEQARR